MLKLEKKTVIITDYKCNNQCRFCIDSNKRELADKPTNEIISEMADARRRERTYLEIIGGEPTIRPDFIHIVRAAKKLGFKTITMATNGRMLSYKDYAERLIGAGITSIIFSIHGHNSKLYDFLTQTKGSFNQLLKGMDNIKKMGFKNIGSNTAIVKDNYKFLPQIGGFLFNLGIRNAEFIFVDPSAGGAHDNFEELVPKISSVVPYAEKCLDLGRKNEVKHWHIRYVPLCLFDNYREQISELHEIRHFQTEHLAPDFKNPDVERSRALIGRVKTEKCKKCVYYDNFYCEGIWKEYVKHYGDSELKVKNPAKLKFKP